MVLSSDAILLNMTSGTFSPLGYTQIPSSPNFRMWLHVAPRAPSLSSDAILLNMTSGT